MCLDWFTVRIRPRLKSVKDKFSRFSFDRGTVLAFRQLLPRSVPCSRFGSSRHTCRRTTLSWAPVYRIRIRAAQRHKNNKGSPRSHGPLVSSGGRLHARQCNGALSGYVVSVRPSEPRPEPLEVPRHLTHVRRRSASFGMRQICRIIRGGGAGGNFESVAQIVDMFRQWSYPVVLVIVWLFGGWLFGVLDAAFSSSQSLLQVCLCEGLADCGSRRRCFFR